MAWTDPLLVRERVSISKGLSVFDPGCAKTEPQMLVLMAPETRADDGMQDWMTNSFTDYARIALMSGTTPKICIARFKL